MSNRLKVGQRVRRRDGLEGVVKEDRGGDGDEAIAIFWGDDPEAKTRAHYPDGKWSPSRKRNPHDVIEIIEDKPAHSNVYIAGPMRGYEKLNFPAFDAAAERLESEGWDVVNPAELSRQAGFDENASDIEAENARFDFADFLLADLKELAGCDAIYMLKGWARSRGAKIELEFAQSLEKELIFAPDAEYFESYSPHTALPVNDVLATAYRLTTGDRNVQYGDPLQDFKRTAAIWSALAGVEISPAKVGLMMIGLKLSRACWSPNKKDHHDDAAGYARCAWLCAEEAN